MTHDNKFAALAFSYLFTFAEFWEDHFHCRYPNSTPTLYNGKHKVPCTTKERLRLGNTQFEAQLQFVSDAVMAFAHAFRDMHRDLCDGVPGLCPRMKPIKGEELLKYLRKIQFLGEFFRLDRYRGLFPIWLMHGWISGRLSRFIYNEVQSGCWKW